MSSDSCLTLLKSIAPTLGLTISEFLFSCKTQVGVSVSYPFFPQTIPDASCSLQGIHLKTTVQRRDSVLFDHGVESPALNSISEDEENSVQNFLCLMSRTTSLKDQNQRDEAKHHENDIENVGGRSPVVLIW